MAISDDDFTTHVNSNRVEFANRQILLRGTGAPGSLPATIGSFYLDENTNVRYEKTGSNDTEWAVFTGSSGSGSSLGWINTASDVTVNINERHLVDTTSGTIQLTLPSLPNVGDTLEFMDKDGTFGINNLTLLRNGNLIMETSEDFVVDESNVQFIVIFVGGSVGWKVYPQNQ